MTLVILLLALLAVFARRGSEPSALPAFLSGDDAAQTHARIAPVERHATDDGLSSQPLLSRPGAQTGKARPAMTSPAQAMRSPWQGVAPIALNLPNPKGPMAIDARIPSGLSLARASARAT